MVNRWITLTEHILKEERNIPQATGKLTFILNQIAEASKIIASHVKNSGLVNIEGKAGTKNIYDEEVQNYLKRLKEKPYKMRYVGSMVADIHRILLKGGIFLYPSDKNQNPLDIQPTDVHQRVPIIMGSKSEVEKFINLQHN